MKKIFIEEKVRKVYTGKISINDIGARDVFVFGSNRQGFHGAGSAGFASFGVFGNHWRDYDYDKKPNDWKGLFNVKGNCTGFQQGTKGWSYALLTIEKPGARRSLTKEQIKENIQRFYYHASQSDWDFIIPFSGEIPNKVNLNGYSNRELAELFYQPNIPKNIIFEQNFWRLIEDARTGARS